MKRLPRSTWRSRPERSSLIDAALADLKPLGVQPEKPPYHPGDREELPPIAFVADPDGYRIELIERGEG